MYGKDIGNRQEIQFVVKLLKAVVLNGSMAKKSVGIITFYRKQKELLQREIGRYVFFSPPPVGLRTKNLVELSVVGSRFDSSKHFSRITINTVDGFQGQEEDLIIVSCVRKNKGNHIGFMSMTERLNVAMTRAKDCLYVCGHLETLRHTEGWDDLIENAQQRQVIHSVSSMNDPEILENLISRVYD